MNNIERFIEIGIALSAEKNHQVLLEKILMTAMEIANADGGTIYSLNDKSELVFDTLINKSLAIHWGGTTSNKITFENIPIYIYQQPNNKALVSISAAKQKVINIADAYNNTEYDCIIAKESDEKMGYRTISVLTLPMTNHEGDLTGVIQLINAQKNGEIVPFSKEIENTMLALSSLAAVIINNKQLIEQMEELFSSFSKLIAYAIDQKSPYTGGHCRRVPEITMMLAKACHQIEQGPLAAFTLSEKDFNELSVAAWLHDCGKVATPEYVMDKATKLETVFDRIELINARLEIASLNIAHNKQLTDSEKAVQLKTLAEERAFLIEANKGGEFFDDEKINRVHQIAGKYTVTLVDSSSAFLKELQGTLKRRGGRSMAYPKHSYRLDLVKHLAIGNLPADDDWILNANYIDKTFLRHALSYQLFRDMDSANWAPQCRYVHLYLNSHYNGLYVLMEKPDKSSMQVHPGGFIFKEPQIFRESYSGLQVQDSLNFHQQKFPKLHEQNFTPTLEAFRTFIRTATPSKFQNEIAQWVDLRNIIDWHLLLLITNNGDGVVKNFYWYALDKNSPMRVAPWDYDHSFGRDGDNELNMDTRPLTIERNILLKRLLTWSSYRRMLSERWHQLNTQKVLSISGLQSRIMEEGARIRTAALRNFEVWPVNGPYYYDANTFDEELQIMHDFIPLRHQRISDYFDSLTDP